QFFQGLYVGQVQTLPADPVLLMHPLLVALLMIVFPYSKLLHAPGLFFSPSRNQVDNPREQRHIAPWAKRLEQD
ncbi:MAG: nitrate reductase, partial [Halochromatium sp.]